MNARVPISLTLDAGMYAGMERRAKVMGKKPVDYIRSLIEAAYAARVGREIKMPATDAELDDAVRAVFCLAGEFSTATIAKATGFTESLVRDVLKGFRIVAGEIKERPKAQKPTTVEQKPAAIPPPMAPAKSPRQSDRAYSPEIVAEIGRLWAAGVSMKDIAAAVGRPAPGLGQWVLKHRDICPKRRV